MDRHKLTGFAQEYRVTTGKKFRLKDFSPDDKADFESDEDAADLLAAGIRHMSDLQ